MSSLKANSQSIELFKNKIQHVPDVITTKAGTSKSWKDSEFENICSRLYIVPTIDECRIIGKVFINAYFGSFSPTIDVAELLTKMIWCLPSEAISRDDSQLHFHCQSITFKGKKMKMDIPITFSSRDVPSPNILMLDDDHWKTATTKYFVTMETPAETQATGLLPGEGAGEQRKGVIGDGKGEIIGGTTPEDARRLYNYLWAGIESSDIEELKDTVIRLVFMAGVLSRKIVKTQASIHNYILHNSFKTVQSIMGCRTSPALTPPHSSFYLLLKNGVTKGVRKSTEMIAHALWLYKTALEHGKTDLRSFLLAMGLLHLKYNGMAVVNAMNAISIHYSTSYKSLLKHLAYEMLLGQLTVVTDVLIDHVPEKEGYKLFPWSRILDDQYHSDLGTTSQKPLLEFLYYLIAIFQPEQEIWAQVPWNNFAPMNNNARAWAQAYNAKQTSSIALRMMEEAPDLEELKKQTSSSRFEGEPV